MFWDDRRVKVDWNVEGQDRNIQLIAYSPLASGLLTDKALTRTDGKATKVYSFCYMNCFLWSVENIFIFKLRQCAVEQNAVSMLECQYEKRWPTLFGLVCKFFRFNPFWSWCSQLVESMETSQWLRYDSSQSCWWSCAASRSCFGVLSWMCSCFLSYKLQKEHFLGILWSSTVYIFS